MRTVHSLFSVGALSRRALRQQSRAKSSFALGLAPQTQLANPFDTAPGCLLPGESGMRT